MINKLFFG